MNNEYQYEINEKWDVVLYYTRLANVPPTEPDFNTLRQENPDFTIDQLLDIFSKLKTKYLEDLEEYKSNDVGGTINGFVFFPFDKTFINNVKNFEKNKFFVEWTKSTKKHITETIIKLSK